MCTTGKALFAPSINGVANWPSSSSAASTRIFRPNMLTSTDAVLFEVRNEQVKRNQSVPRVATPAASMPKAGLEMDGIQDGLLNNVSIVAAGMRTPAASY